MQSPSGHIANNWAALQAQMHAFCTTVDTAIQVNSKLEELVKNIWDRIIIGEYITYSGKTVSAEQPQAITSEVVDCYSKHLFKNTFINDQAKETSAQGGAPGCRCIMP
jgi:hypothetical protein